MNTLAVIAAIGVAVISALGAYLAAAKRLSGRIDTTEAAELWKEAASQRESDRARLTAVEQRNADLEARMAALERDNLRLMREALDYAAEISRLRSERDDLTATVAALQATIKGRRADDGTS